MISNNISDNDIMSIVYDRYEDYFRNDEAEGKGIN